MDVWIPRRGILGVEKFGEFRVGGGLMLGGDGSGKQITKGRC